MQSWQHCELLWLDMYGLPCKTTKLDYLPLNFQPEAPNATTLKVGAATLAGKAVKEHDTSAFLAPEGKPSVAAKGKEKKRKSEVIQDDHPVKQKKSKKLKKAV